MQPEGPASHALGLHAEEHGIHGVAILGGGGRGEGGHAGAPGSLAYMGESSG
jgi:hypothetical protein